MHLKLVMISLPLDMLLTLNFKTKNQHKPSKCYMQ